MALLVGKSEVAGEMESAALSGLAFHPEPSPKKTHEPRCDREPQSRPAILAGCGAVRLRESVENHMLLLSWNTNPGIADSEMKQDAAFILCLPFDVHGDFSLLGKLHRIAHEVHQYLAQPAHIAFQVFRYSGSNTPGKFEIFQVSP